MTITQAAAAAAAVRGSGSSSRLSSQHLFWVGHSRPERGGGAAGGRGGGGCRHSRCSAADFSGINLLLLPRSTNMYSYGNTTFWATVNRDWAKLYIVQHEILHFVEQQSPWYSLIEPTNDLQYNVSKMKVLWQTAESNISLHLNVLMTSCDTSKFKESNKSGNEKSDPYCGVRGWPLVVGVEWTGGGATMATIVGGQVFVLPR